MDEAGSVRDYFHQRADPAGYLPRPASERTLAVLSLAVMSNGAPVLLLTTVGARTGHRRTTPLIYLEDGDDVVLVASKGGMALNPAWYHNLIKNPQADIQIGSEVRRMTARRASDEEKALLWPRLLEVYRDYDDYQARTERNIPVMVLSRT